MALAPGARLGPYEVIAQIGMGGMGEVYRARDTRLKREVAIKVLPEALSTDAARLARFQREAEVLASLNHPNIAQIYGLEDADRAKALVMELVEGPTLADRTAGAAGGPAASARRASAPKEGPPLRPDSSTSNARRGGSLDPPMPIDEALSIARQIAEALEAAHEQGIIHRDLKPANIKVRPDGTVKVLDFGLAKAMEPASATSPTASISPTITSPALMTGVGMILGTAAYMSPEQARGKAVDKRADIWAFGCVLYEMLTGRRAFAGDEVSDTLASVLAREPDFDALPPSVPARVGQVLRLCLRKDAKQRAGDIRDVRLALDGAFETPVPQAGAPVVTQPARWRRVAAFTASALVVGGVLTAVTLVRVRRTTEPARVSFEVPTNSPGGTAPYMIAISPDGRNLVAQITEDGVNKLWVRPIERVTGVTLKGTELGTSNPYPFWSPDGRYIGFCMGGRLKKVGMLGAMPESLSDAGCSLGGTWSRDDVILFAPTATGPLFRIAASGGQQRQVTELNKARAETSHRFPKFLPDGVHFLYLAISSKRDETGIYVGALNSKNTKRVVASTSQAEFAAPDLLLFLRDSTLIAQRFDTSRLELSGDPFQVAENVAAGLNTRPAAVSVSENGVLAYRPDPYSGRTLTWFDRSGTIEGTIGDPASYENPRLSPDGKRLAVFKPDGGGDIWVTDLERGNSTRVTFDPAADQAPVWSPDGTLLAFASNRDGGVFNLYQKGSDGTGNDELLLKTPRDKLIEDWSSDGRFVLYQEVDPNTKADLWVLPLFGDRKPMRVLGTPFNERRASFSPDGRWIAYSSDEAGRGDVYVQSFPASGRKWQVSTMEGASPRWRADGKELFYDMVGNLMAVDLTGTVPGEFRAGTPRMLFRALLNLPPHEYDLTPDGRRFLVVTTENRGNATPIVVVVNWTSGLAQPAK